MKNICSIVEAKEKLKDLKRWMPGANYQLVAFGSVLAGCLQDSLSPMGFVNSCGLALSDLAAGVDLRTKKTISSPIVGQAESIYNTLRSKIPDIARAVLPEDFASDVQTYVDLLKGVEKEVTSVEAYHERAQRAEAELWQDTP
jgi:hypothetical protein